MTGCGNRNDAVNGIARYGCGERTDTLTVTVECRAANFGPESNRCRIRARQGNRHRYFFRPHLEERSRGGAVDYLAFTPLEPYFGQLNSLSIDRGIVNHYMHSSPGPRDPLTHAR